MPRSRTDSARGASGGLPFWLLLAGALVAGMVLRTWGLPHQIILDDELHAVRNVVLWDLSTILTNYRGADPCIPLAASFELLTGTGVRLTEVLVRTPSLVAGGATIVALPLLARPFLGTAAAATFSWLLALSPTLVYYGRIGRPYALVAFLGPCALAAFWRFWESLGEGSDAPPRRGRALRWGAAYAVLGGLTSWLHLLTAPFLAAPLAVAAAAKVLPGGRSGAWREWRHWLALAAVGAGLAAAVAAHLVPAWDSLRILLRHKAAASAPTLSTVSGALALQAGSVSWVPAAIFWGLALLGLVVLVRRARRPVVLGATAVVLQWLTILILRPQAGHLPLVVNRYVLVTLPLVLAAVAVALVRLWTVRARPAARWAARAAVVGTVVALAWAHPHLRDPALRFGPWAGSNESSSFEPRSSPATLPPELVPAAYRVIASEPGDAPVLEAPSGAAWFLMRGQIALWRVHERPTVVAIRNPWILTPEAREIVAFRTLVPAEPAAMSAAGARFVVVHRDLPFLNRVARELEAGASWQPGLVGPTPHRHGAMLAARALQRALYDAWRPPDLEDPQVLVWDLARRPPERPRETS